MTLTDRHRTQPQITVTLRRRGVGRLRQTYFSQAWETAARYRIPFDRVIRHIWRARKASRRLTLRHIRHMEDVIHVIACIEGINLAWVDLAEQYERALIRQCRGSHDEVAAVMLVRRLFVELRRTMHDDPAGVAPGFAGFSGQQPLGAWLCERLNALRTREALMHVQRRAIGGRPSGAGLRSNDRDHAGLLVGERLLPLSMRSSRRNQPFDSDSEMPAGEHPNDPPFRAASADG